ncbi:MAG: adenosylhomocysteinase [Arachnia sp.]
MTHARRHAERLLRRFARETNLLIAGRPANVTGEGQAADALRAMLAAMGARVDHPAATTPGLVSYDVEGGHITLDGAPLPARPTAAARLDFAASTMGVSRRIAAEIAPRVAGLRIGISMTLEPKTAVLGVLLRDAGAEVAVYAHPDETDPEVADELRARGIPVDADAGLARNQERAAALGFLGRGFDVFVDDGSHLTRLAHEADLTRPWIGATEETTSGLTPLRHMAAAGVLRVPVIAVNDAATKTGYDNRYGTGQSCVLAIADLLEAAGLTLRDQPAVVIGYGPVGVGVAAHLRALGAEVSIAEIDPVRALLATHDGYRVGRAAEMAPGALVISATGVAGTVPAEVTSTARAVAVAGGVVAEIAWDGDLHPVAPHVDQLAGPGTRPLILDRGSCINVTAAEGNPIEIMDLSFATQLAAVAELVDTRPGVGVHALSAAAVAHVAAVAAAERGLQLEPGLAPGESEAEWRSPRFTRDDPPASSLTSSERTPA